MNSGELQAVASAIVAGQKGILAADESVPTIEKRFASVNVESTEANRRHYRELLFTTEGIESSIGGVILHDETMRQATRDGIPFAELLSSRGIHPGIKVDQGYGPLPLHPGENITEGLDQLRRRLEEYKQLGAKFAKWRAVIAIDEHALPSSYGIAANAHALARYAALCQELDIVPIVEPEVLMDGAHDIARCEAVTSQVLQEVFSQLCAHRVLFEGMLLKPNMVIAGMKCPQQADVPQVAAATLRCLRRHVPAAVPGIVFLSGGQNPAEATAHLNDMNKTGPHPWEVSFSYGRALQAPVLAAWQGQDANVGAAQEAFAMRCRLNGLARAGRYAPSMEPID